MSIFFFVSKSEGETLLFQNQSILFISECVCLLSRPEELAANSTQKNRKWRRLSIVSTWQEQEMIVMFLSWSLTAFCLSHSPRHVNTPRGRSNGGIQRSSLWRRTHFLQAMISQWCRCTASRWLHVCAVTVLQSCSSIRDRPLCDITASRRQTFCPETPSTSAGASQRLVYPRNVQICRSEPLAGNIKYQCDSKLWLCFLTKTIEKRSEPLTQTKMADMSSSCSTNMKQVIVNNRSCWG